MSVINVRLANEGDLDQVGDLFNLYRVFYGKDHDVGLARSFVSERFQNNQSVIFVAEDTDRGLIGFVQLYPSFSSVSACATWILNDLYVLESHRQQGAASQLIKRCIDFCKEQKAGSLSLETAMDNKTAQSLYEKIGFEKNTTFFVYSIKCS